MSKKRNEPLVTSETRVYRGDPDKGVFARHINIHYCGAQVLVFAGVRIQSLSAVTDGHTVEFNRRLGRTTLLRRMDEALDLMRLVKGTAERCHVQEFLRNTLYSMLKHPDLAGHQ